MQEFTIKRIFHDPSSGQINNGLFNCVFPIIFKTNLPKKEKDELKILTTMLSLKLASLWEVKEQYIANLVRLRSELVNERDSEKNVKMRSVQATDLLGWFDLFLVQIKSILDHLVKIPSPVFGYNKWSLVTFGEKGEVVKKSFLNLSKEYKERTKNYYEIIFGPHHWIEEAIDLRDRLNHGKSGGVDQSWFTVSLSPNSNTFIEPMWSNEQTIESAMEVIFDSMLKLTTIFCSMILCLKLPDDYTVVCDWREEKITKPICNLILKSELKNQLESQGIDYKGD